MSVSKIDILNHNFSRSLRGYNPQEVDGYLQDIADTIGHITEEKTALANQVAILEAQLAEHKEREATLRDTLITTQKLTDSLKATAQKEAQLIIDSAHSRAESLMQQGNFRLAQLNEGIAETRKLKAQFEMRIRSMVEQHLKLLDMEIEDDESLQDQLDRVGSAD